MEVLVIVFYPEQGRKPTLPHSSLTVAILRFGVKMELGCLRKKRNLNFKKAF